MQLEKKQVRSLYFISYLLLVVMIINSLYLSYNYLNYYYGATVLTSFDCTDDCDSVMMSEYSMLFGIPIPVYGLLYFIVIAVFFVILTRYNNPSASWLTRMSQLFISKDRYQTQKKVFEILLIIGCIAAAGFLYLLYFVLGSMCKFCLLSHSCLFLFVIIYFFLLKRFKFKL